MSPILTTIVVVFIAWFWTSTLRAREKALELSKKACESVGVQLLDQTVALGRLGVGREPDGRLGLHRVYNFEFSTDGQQRYQGKVAMRGQNVKAIHLDHPEGPIVMQPDHLG